jgi:hypothetical protein
MADVLRTVGIDLSEPMAFGLGAGPAFVLVEGAGFTPSTMFFGRSIGFEQDLCRALGVAFDDRSQPNFDEAWPVLHGGLQEGRPALLVTDIKYLPHYGTSTHFNGHRVVLAGEDAAAGTALVADTHFDGLCEVPFASLRAAMESDAPPVTIRDCSFAFIESPREKPDLHAAARSAVQAAAQAQFDDGGYTGVPGIERLARSMARWSDRADRDWCARFGYQVIERRGTGGGLFRRLYSRFLSEAGETLPDPELLGLAPIAGAAANAWTALAEELKALSEQKAPTYDKASELALAAAAGERALWEAARRVA